MFEITQPTFRQLLLPDSSAPSVVGAVYRVPPFQRDYAWGENQWDDLWRDLEALSAAFSNGDSVARHYMGCLVTRADRPGRSGEENLLVIDGQQRMATLTILMLACAEEFGRLAKSGEDEEENAKRAEETRRDFVGPEDPVTRRPVCRLFLNRNDDRFFKNHVVMGERPFSFDRRKRSNRLLWEALKFFRARLGTGGRGGGDIARLVKAAGDGLAFTVMRVSSDLNAYQIFETLNARGMDLSQSDLVKNLLFQKAEDGGRIEEMDALWQDMEGEVGGAGVVDFFRCLWNSRRELSRPDELYRCLRREFAVAESAFHFATDAQRRAEIYTALQNPLHWRKNQGGARDSVDALTFAFGARQHLPLLLAAHDPDDLDERGPRADFFNLLEWVEIFHFRRAVISKAPAAEMELVYNRAALALREALREARGGNGMRKVREILADADVTAEQFRQNFAEAEFNAEPDNLEQTRMVRYILGKLERKMGGDAALDGATIEHILPRRAGEEWDEFFPPDMRANFVHRLGNYCLLSKEDNNNQADNLPYAEKRGIYQRSAYRTASECGERHSEWGPAELEERQERMADLAAKIWRLPP